MVLLFFRNRYTVHSMKTLFKWIPAAFIIGCSWYLSSQPTIVHMPVFPYADKLVHFICFGGLSFWISFAVHSKKAAAIALTSFYGIIDEIHQHFVAGRSCSLFDWMADTVGAIAGYFCFRAIQACFANLLNREEKPLHSEVV
ncbi:MAG: VanZ family protein [Treponema sp.]|nr:VanZ family protein [Treponema sp.]